METADYRSWLVFAKELSREIREASVVTSHTGGGPRTRCHLNDHCQGTHIRRPRAEYHRWNKRVDTCSPIDDWDRPLPASLLPLLSSRYELTAPSRQS